MTEAESNLQIDLINNYFSAKARFAVAPCRKEALRRLGDTLLSGESAWEPIKYVDQEDDIQPAFAAVLRSQNGNWGSTTWEAEVGRGTFNSISAGRRAQINYVFHMADEIDRLQTDITRGESRLKALASITELTRQERLRYLDQVMEIDQYGHRAEILSARIVDFIDTMDLDLSEDELTGMQRGLNRMNSRNESIYGECAEEISFTFRDDVDDAE
ncbi:MAG: hypothetical protein AAGJ29_00785 [Pseudomonadota bacterium]